MNSPENPPSLEQLGALLLRNIEPADRSGTAETPARWAKAWAELTRGYATDPASVLKAFDDGAEHYDQMVLQCNIPVYSLCEHHLLPFFGVAHLAYIPRGKIVGLSKLSRLVDVFSRRLQVQERLTNQIARALSDAVSPEGVAVVLECRHLCMEMRGIQRMGTSTTTSSMHGLLLGAAPRAEFFSLLRRAQLCT